jgi:hypothetical protein
MNFQGSTTMPEPPRCAFPSCTNWGGHDHHITYDPPVTKRLCVRHHEEITIINGQQARKYRRTLSNKHRWWIWFQWIEGKLKARRTQKALEYTGEWSAVAAKHVEGENEKQIREEKNRQRITFIFPTISSDRATVGRKRRSVGRTPRRRKKMKRNKTNR